VSVAKRSRDQLSTAGEDIESALTALEDIAESVGEASHGIREIAEANDQQATNIQEVREMVEAADDRTDASNSSSNSVTVSALRSESGPPAVGTSTRDGSNPRSRRSRKSHGGSPATSSMALSARPGEP